MKSASALLIDSEQMDRLQEIAAAAASSAVEGIEKRVDVSEELSAHRDELINVLGELPVNIADSATLDSYQRAIGDFVSHLSNITARLNNVEAEAQDALDAYRSRFNEDQKSLESRLGQTQNEIEAKLQATRESIDAIKVDVEAQKTRLDAALNQFSTDTVKAAAEADSNSKRLMASLQETFDEEMGRLNEEGIERLETLKNYEEQAKKLVDATANSTISADYGGRARQERLSANLWSIGAVVVALLGLVVIAIGMANIHEAAVPETIWKTSATIVLLAVAGYMGKEAGAHRKEERDAKRAQLDLNAFNPFLTLMNEDDARELRKEFAHRIFNRPLANLKSENGFGFENPLLRGGKRAHQFACGRLVEGDDTTDQLCCPAAAPVLEDRVARAQVLLGKEVDPRAAFNRAFTRVNGQTPGSLRGRRRR